MRKTRQFLSWLGIIVLGLAHGILEDLMFLQILVEHMPADWDLTGDLYFSFTVPLAQLMALAVTGPVAWFFLGLHESPKLITFWLCWMLARTVVLAVLYNPLQDILTYLAWITLWCGLLGVLAHRRGRSVPQN